MCYVNYSLWEMWESAQLTAVVGALIEVGGSGYPAVWDADEAFDLLRLLCRSEAEEIQWGRSAPGAISELVDTLTTFIRYHVEGLRRLKVQRRDLERVAAAVTVGPRILERLRGGSAEPALKTTPSSLRRISLPAR